MARTDPLPSTMGAYGASRSSAGPQDVERFHDEDDLNAGRSAQHHDLGTGANQASPGNHRHDGRDSVALLDGITLTGSRGGNTALPSIISALVLLGAVDNTTA